MSLEEFDGLVPGFERPRFKLGNWRTSTERHYGSGYAVLGTIYRSPVVTEHWIAPVEPANDILFEKDSLLVKDGMIWCVCPITEFQGDWGELLFILLETGYEKTAEKLVLQPSVRNRVQIGEEELMKYAGKNKADLLAFLNRNGLLLSEVASAVLRKAGPEEFAGEVKVELMRAIVQ